MRKKVVEFFTPIKSMIFIIIAIVLWMVSGMFFKFDDKDNNVTNIININYKTILPQMEVKRKLIKVNGTTEAKDKIEIASEASGHVIKLTAHNGQFLEKGDEILQLTNKGVKALFKSAEENLKKAEIAYEAAINLQKKGLGSELEMNNAKSDLHKAEAALDEAKNNIENIIITAPFKGFIDKINVQKGDYVGPGKNLGIFLLSEQLNIILHVPEKYIDEAKLARKAFVKVGDNNNHEASIAFISKVANSDTRTFRVEAILPNNELKLQSGISVEAYLDIGEKRTHKVPQSALSLNEEGDIGVKAINKRGIVEFYRIIKIAEDSSGIWVEGLPHKPEVITLGHAYVEAGEKLR